MIPRLLIAGYYGFNNAGDELILDCLLSAWSEYRETITVLSHAPKQTSVDHNIRAVSRWQPFVLAHELAHCDYLVFGGGGLIQDLSGPFSPLYYLGLLFWARLLGKKTLLLGQGIGPLLRKRNLWLARAVLRQVGYCQVRDQASLEFCQHLGVPKEKIVLAADLVWMLEPLAKNHGRGWSVCLRADKLDSVIPDWVYELSKLSKKKEKPITFVALGDQGDADYLSKLKQDPQFAECRFVYATRPEACRLGPSLFADQELVVSMRYHGLVLGALAGAAVVGWGDDPKLCAVAEELGQDLLPAEQPELALAVVLASLPEKIKCVHEHGRVLQQRCRAGLLAAKNWMGKFSPQKDRLL